MSISEAQDPHSGSDMLNSAEHLRTRIEQALRFSIDDILPKRLQEAMSYSLLGTGKRIRPTLCLMTFEIFSDKIDVAIPTACALEMLHTATLIHDDLPAMDDDDFRRGRPTNHRVFGEGMAVLAGDALLAYSLEFILDHAAGLSTERLLAVMTELIRVVGPSGLSGGQALDLTCQGRASVDVNTVEQMHLMKTGSLIRASVVTGAILGGANKGDIAHLEHYARNLGLAFQIADDVLDEVSNFATFGKVVGGDRAAGKWTYPRVVGTRAARERAQELIASAVASLDTFGDRAATLRSVAELVARRAAA